MKTAKHWIALGYLHLKTQRASTAFKLEGTPEQTARLNIAELDVKIQRMQRQRSTLGEFLDGKTESHPDALV